MSSSTTDTRDTGDGTTGTPGLGRGLVTSLLADSVRLTLVLGKARYTLGQMPRQMPIQRCTHCALAERHQDGSVRSKPPGEEERRKPLNERP